MSHPIRDYFRYLAVSDRDRQWGLYVTAGGFNAIAPGDPYPRTGHPREYAFAWSCGRVLHEYQAHYVTRGQGEFESEPSGGKAVDAGNAFLLFPGVWHRYRPIAEAGWDEYWVSFGGDYVARLVEQGFFSPVDPVLTTGSSDVILHAYLTFIDRLRSEPTGFERLLAASVMEILAGMLGAVHAHGTDSRNLEGIRQAKLILEEDMTQVPAIEKLAAAVGMSTTHFHRVFRRQTGLSPYQYHLQLRINRAREMLSGSALTVKEISVALGFESAFHFSKIFKKKAGQSPHHFRRSIQPPTVR
jgi:AraC-like DNA-binding protein